MGRGLNAGRSVQQVAAASGRAPLHCHPASPHHGCRALLFRFARLGIRDPRRETGFMNRSQGPGQGPLAPDAGRKVGPGGGSLLSEKPGGDALPRGAGSRHAAPALPPCGPHPLRAPELLGWSSWGGAVRPGAASPASASYLGSEGSKNGASSPGEPVFCPPLLLPCSHLRLLVHSPSRPVATAQTERGQQRERKHLRIQSWHWTAFSPPGDE